MPKPATKALIIDYEPRGIKQLRDPLEAEGFEILLAKDGIAGLDAFKQQNPDIVLIEAMIPKRHGFEVCQEMKGTESGRNTPVIVVSSVYKGRKYRSQAIHQHGADEFLEKPIASEKLLATVERLLAGRMPQQATAAATEPPIPPVVPPVPSATVSAPVTPPVVAKPTPTPAADSAEAEIVERLNQILGD